MAASTHFREVDAATCARIRQVIEQETSQLTSAWMISVIADQKNDQWQVQIEYAGTYIKSETFDGATGEHEPEVFRNKFCGMLQP